MFISEEDLYYTIQAILYHTLVKYVNILDSKPTVDLARSNHVFHPGLHYIIFCNNILVIQTYNIIEVWTI